MATRLTNETPMDKATIRQPKIKVVIDRWDWTTGAKKDADGIDITKSVTSYAFTKTTKTPMGGCQLTVVPLFTDPLTKTLKHVLDVFDPMDVVKIYEFDTLKFQGYIRNIGANGSIGGDGKPSRSAVIVATHIGGLLYEGQLGLQIFATRMAELKSTFSSYQGAMIAFMKAVADELKTPNANIGTLTKLVIDQWFVLLDKLSAGGVSMYRTYLNTYIDYATILTNSEFGSQYVTPKDASFFYGSMDNMTLWNEIIKLSEPPFNEFWFDEGQRSVWLSSSAVDMPDQKTYLVGRPTPFDGTVSDSGTGTAFTDMTDVVTIPLGYNIRFDFNKSMEDSYSFYLSLPIYTGFNEIELMAHGDSILDDDKFNKYLLRPLRVQKFYTSVADKQSTKADSQASNIVQECKNVNQTMQNWFTNNDKFLSGNISMMVPSDSTLDAHIGQKLQVTGIDGYFYVEGISHRWQYGGPLMADISASRGYGKDAPIELDHAIFTTGKFLGSTQEVPA
jgi:hypothetical protein